MGHTLVSGIEGFFSEGSAFRQSEICKCEKQPAQFVRTILEEDVERPHWRIIVGSSHQAQGGITVLRVFGFGKDASPDEVR